MKPKKSGCFSTKVDVALAEKLKTDLEDQGFKICKPPYTLFSALKKGVTCTLYKSGSLTVQGKDKDAFIEFYLEPEVLKNFSYTHPLAHVDMTPRIGSDEAGKGDFFGPLCVASLYADAEGIKKLSQLGVRDSKRLSDESIKKVGSEIKRHFRHYIFKLGPEKYNELYSKFNNLNRMLAWMHTVSIEHVYKNTGCTKVIVDQFAKEHVLESMFEQKGLEPDLEQKVRAEEDVVVAAASILARMTFVEEMDKLSNALSMHLPKGASRLVVDAGKKILARYDSDMLDKVSKMHFKTRQEIMNLS